MLFIFYKDKHFKHHRTMINFSRFSSLFSLVSYFDTDKKCKDVLAKSRWEDGDVVCPYCGGHHCYTRKDGRFSCKHCKKSFNVTVGTIFENTKISLRKWFIAMYLVSSHKKGISSCQIARDINVTQKTAWYMLMKIRSLYGQNDQTALVGEVEVDEMYLGGQEKWKHECKKTEGTQGRSTKTKTPIFGMQQRSGDVKVIKVKDTKAETLFPIIKQFVEENSTIFTDEHNGYNPVGKEDSGYVRKIVNHKINEFAYDEVTTNRIEGFWSHFKRMIYGVYHFVSVKHLQSYIDESVYRWNTREWSEGARFADMFSKCIGKVSYEDIRMCA